MLFWLVWRFCLVSNSKILHSGSILTWFDTKNISVTKLIRQAFLQIFANINLFKACIWCLHRLKFNQNVKFCCYTSNQTFKLVKKAKKMDFFQNFPTEKVATHLKSFLGSYRIFGMVRMLVTKNKSNICLRPSVSPKLEFCG